MVQCENVESFLAEFVGKRVIFQPNPGNAGDSVIACAEYLLFDKIKLKVRLYSECTEAEVGSCDLLIYGGGGNLVDLYPNAASFIEKWHQKVRRLVVLPHTVRGHRNLIANLGANVTIFCRDEESYEYVAGVNSVVSCRRDHDVACTLAVRALKTRPSELGYRFTYQFSLRSIKRLVRSAFYLLRCGFSRRDLFAYRADSEGTGKAGRLNIDVSQAFAADGMSREDSLETVAAMARFIDLFRVVHTDRLHVCIVSALLGKKVMFYDNSYGKNRAVFEATMKAHFPNVALIG